MLRIVFTLLLTVVLYFSNYLQLNPVMAAETSNQNPNLSIVEDFLTSIPSDYYTVRDIKAIKNLTKEKQALLIDVRSEKEYNSGHIPTAINIPLRTLTAHLDLIPKNRPVILYCTTGYRTAMGVMALQMLGYDNVKGYPPSFQGWKTAGELISIN